jgi:ActR/RegA family two-component response regulator
VTRRLFVIEDDLFFAQRVRQVASRIGVPIEGVSLQQARESAWEPDSVVVVQATLNPDRQLGLIEQLVARQPAPIVIAVTGHLETELRQRVKARGALLAAHSSMERSIARALGISAPDDAASSRPG